MAGDKEEGKALWDTVEVKDETVDKRKGEERSSICDILTKSLIGVCLGFVVLALAVIQYISFATMAHRESTFGSDFGPLSHVGLEGVSHIGFMLAMILPDIRSFFYSIHFWIYRGAKFPIKKWKLWVPVTVSEVIYAFGQGLFIFFVAPYIEDSSMIVGAYLIITMPLILSILFPQRSMKNWNYDERTWDEEKLTVYNRRRRIIYGISLALNLSAFSFYITELLSNPIEESYWNEMEKISDGGTCRDSCRASMAAVAFLMMSLSNWLNFINSIHENSFFGGEQAQNFKDARIQELEIFPIFTIASLLRIATTCGFWAYRVARVRSYSGECTESHLDFFGWFEFGIEYRECGENANDTCLFMNLESWLALFALVYLASDWCLVTISKMAVRAKLHRIAFLGPLLIAPAVATMLLAFHPIEAEHYAANTHSLSCIPKGNLYRFGHGNVTFPVDQHWALFSCLLCGFLSLALLMHYMFFDRSAIYSLDRHLFSIPVFRPIFTTTSLLTARKREDDPDHKLRRKIKNEKTSEYYDEMTQSIPMLFICTTLWHEEDNEMEQLLNSLVRLCVDNQQKKEDAKAKCRLNKKQDFYNIEIHIFFDNVFEKKNGKTSQSGLQAEWEEWKELNKWVCSFCEILQSLLIFYEVDQSTFNFEVMSAPYGGRFEMTIAGVPFFVHLKDVEYTQNGKRWSQVMYMYYLIGYRMKNCHQEAPSEFFYNKVTDKIEQSKTPLTEENTYIMALDGDVNFMPHSLDLVLDRLTRNKHVAAACNEIRPIGSGWLVWFQKFEYAVGHWLQKTTEHVLGCVLCSPGCFSIIRIKYLTMENVMGLYKSIAETPMQKLMYDQGEDRWLCTRLLLAGGRIEFEAGSDCDTFAPEDLATFYKQRRRWGPSTTANIWELITNAKKAMNNPSISVFYLIYHAVMMFMALIGVSTTAMMISQALEFAATGGAVFEEEVNVWAEIWPKLVVFLPILIYFILCGMESMRDYQLKAASWLSAAYSFLMLYVLIALLVQGIRCPFNPTFIFFCFMAAIMIIAAILHGEFVTLMCGVVYWLCIPSCFIFLQIYSLANMNDVSWGTRQSGGGSGGDPRSFWDRLCCKPIPEEEPKEKISEKESEDAKKQFDRMQTVRKKQQSQKRWTQKTKRTKTHGITNLVKKAKLSLKQMNSNAGDKDTIEAISSNLSNKKYLKQSSNFEEFQYVPIDKNNFLTKVPSKSSYDNKVAVEQRIKEDVESDEYLSWAVVKQRPILLRENTRCVTMSHYEYKFWLDMTDIKTGYIKKQGKDPDDAKAMQERSDKMTSEMKTFKNRMYHSFIYINLLWIVICSIVQIFGHKLKIYIFSEAFINSIYPEDVENEWHQQCRSNMLAGFPPFEFFFLFFYILLITIQFCCMVRHRFSTLTHWLAAINLKRSFEKAQKEVSRQASTK